MPRIVANRSADGIGGAHDPLRVLALRRESGDGARWRHDQHAPSRVHDHVVRHAALEGLAKVAEAVRADDDHGRIELVREVDDPLPRRATDADACLRVEAGGAGEPRSLLGDRQCVRGVQLCGVPKFSARTEKSAICRQDTNFGTPQVRPRPVTARERP
jgi:hypothetical protein